MQGKESMNLEFPSTLAASIYGDKWLFPPHIEYLEAKALKAFNEKESRIIVNMPPRHGKSEYISKMLPLWWLLNKPDDRIMLVTYSSSLSEYFGREVMNLVKSYGKKVGVKIDKSQRSKSEFITNKGGGLLSVGTEGPLTGKGADLLIVDDPIKNDKEANSATKREALNDWFRATALTRLEPGGSVIIVMTRWHEDDLCGNLLNSENEWELIKFPAIAEEDDALGRKEGEALWTERYSKDAILDIKQNLGSYWFSGLYQQRPAPAEGGLFKRENFKYFSIKNNIIIAEDKKLDLKMQSIFMTCDLAISTLEEADYTVLLVFALDNENKLFILDVIRERIPATKHNSLIKNIYYKYKPSLIGIETVQYQDSLAESLMNEGFPVQKLNPKSDKFTRALPCAALFEAGKVYINKNLHNIGDIEKELLVFPNGKHDDIVDALAYAVEFKGSRSTGKPVGGGRKSRKLAAGFR